MPSSHKFDNIDVNAYNSVMRVSPLIVVDREYSALSERALVDKGMISYLNNIDKDLLKPRIKYGFLNKRSAGKVKFFEKRWFFMISSRPLDTANFLNDPRSLDETLIPPLLELDTLYYYIMGKAGDLSGQCGEIKTLDILSVSVKDMAKSKKETGHALMIDTGGSHIHLNTACRFELEKWLEALLCSMQTAREIRLSLRGKCRNIAKIIRDFRKDEAAFKNELT